MSATMTEVSTTSSPATPAPTIDTKQLLVNIIDGRAHSEPDTVYAEVPRNPATYEEGFRQITYKDLANAVNGLAWWLQDTLGPGKNFETVCYMGGNDIRYTAILLASVKAGYKCLFTSPRNSIAAHLNLFKVTDCHTMIAPNPPPPFVAPIVAAGGLKLLAIPSVEDLLTKEYPHFPYKKTYEQAKSEPLVVLHTSGTTGLPKPIIWTHAYASAWGMWNRMPAPEGFSKFTDIMSSTGSRIFVSLPPFHAGNLFATLLPASWARTVPVFYAGAIPSGRSLVEALKHTKINTTVLAPPFLEEIGKDDEMLDAVVQKMDSVFFAGGDISAGTGDKITKRIKLFPILGATETGLLPNIYPTGNWPVDDWKWFKFHPEAMIDLQHQSDNAYEAVVKRHQDPSKTPAAFTIFPNQEEYRTKDLFSPHPTKPDLWIYVGRADDIIVFLNGEKTNPVTFEHHVARHPDVKGALVIGTLRMQPALLIEPATDKALSTVEKAEFIEKIWPTVQEANEEAPQHARVSKSFIFFTDPSKPLDRAGKGTIQRKPTIDKFAEEIDALYADAEKVTASGDQNDAAPSVDAHDPDQVSSFVQKSVADLMGTTDLKEDDEFFGFGMDSLKALELTRVLRKNLGLWDLEINTIYLNGSIAELTKAIVQLAAQGQASKASAEHARHEVLEDSLAKYTDQVNKIAASISDHPSPAEKSDVGRVVALTGSTGALGSYTLHALLESSSIAHVYCLNRASDSDKLQTTRSEARGLPTDFPPEKVTFLTVDLSKANFGLDSSTYSRLQSEVTDIIHNAWTVNYNLPLSTYQGQLSGLVNLISFASKATTTPSLLFVSSLSAVAGSSVEPRPEQIEADVNSPMYTGYGESKWLAERILEHAATKISSLKVKIARAGQLSGAAFKSGGWNKSEWLPALVTSSYHLGAIPDVLGFEGFQIDWVPIDVLGDVLVDFILNDDGSSFVAKGAEVLHPVHPQPTSWPELLPSVLNVFKARNKDNVETVSYDQWLKRVRADADTWADQTELEQKLQANPSIKILDYFEGLNNKGRWPKVSADKAHKQSAKLRDLESIRPEWMERWVEGWI